MTDFSERTSTVQRVLAAVYRVGILGLMGGNVAALLLAAHPLRAVEFLKHSLFSWQMIKGGGLSIRQFHELYPQTPEHLNISILPRCSGYLDLIDAHYTKDFFYLSLLARVLSPKVVFEIGTFEGQSALLFALNTPADAKVFTLDLPKGSQAAVHLPTTVIDDAHIKGYRAKTKYLYEGKPCSSKIKQLYGDSALLDFRPWHGGIDLFFIDGAHSYEYVRSDTLRALECCHAGSVIAWHDYGRWGVNGVSRWLHALAKEHPIHRFPGSSVAVMQVGVVGDAQR